MWNLSGMFGESYEASVTGEAEGEPELPLHLSDVRCLRTKGGVIMWGF